MCAKWCKNSRYVEYKERRHFFVELKDKQGEEMKPLSTGFARASKTKKRALHTKSKARLYFLDLDKD